MTYGELLAVVKRVGTPQSRGKRLPFERLGSPSAPRRWQVPRTWSLDDLRPHHAEPCTYGFGYGWQGSSARRLPRRGGPRFADSQLVKGAMGRSVGCWLPLPGPVPSSLSVLGGGSISALWKRGVGAHTYASHSTGTVGVIGSRAV